MQVSTEQPKDEPAHLSTEAAIPDGIGAAAPPERVGRAELRRQRSKDAPARLQQQPPPCLLPGDVGEHQSHVLVGVWVLPLAVQKALQEDRTAAWQYQTG